MACLALVAIFCPDHDASPALDSCAGEDGDDDGDDDGGTTDDHLLDLDFAISAQDSLCRSGDHAGPSDVPDLVIGRDLLRHSMDLRRVSGL